MTRLPRYWIIGMPRPLTGTRSVLILRCLSVPLDRFDFEFFKCSPDCSHVEAHASIAKPKVGNFSRVSQLPQTGNRNVQFPRCFLFIDQFFLKILNHEKWI